MGLDAVRRALLQYAVKTPGGKVTFILDNREFFNSRECAFEAAEAASALWEKLSKFNPSVIVHKGFGSATFATLVAHYAAIAGTPVHLLSVRESRKKYSMVRLVEGPPPDRVPACANAVFVDDIFNRGRTFEDSKKACRVDGYDLNFVAAGALVDFGNKSRAYEARLFPVVSLFTRAELGLSRADHTESIVKGIKWHALYLNKDVGLEVKSWPRRYWRGLYVGSDDGSFSCFDAETGDRLWRHQSERPQYKGNVCVPAIKYGAVYISSYDGTVRKLSCDTGEQEWAVKVDLNLHSSPILHPCEQRLFVATEWDKHGDQGPESWIGQGDIVCLDTRTGQELWRTPTQGMIPCTPAYSAAHNAVICGSNDFHTYLLNAENGNLHALYKNKGEVKGTPLLLADMFITLSVRGWLQAFSYHHTTPLWEKKIGDRAIHSYPVAFEGLIYVVNESGMVYCINPDGGTEWVCRLRGKVGWGLTFWKGRVIALTEQGQMVSMCPRTGRKLSSDRLQSIATLAGVRTMQPPTFDYVDNVAFIATNNRGLVALHMEEL